MKEQIYTTRDKADRSPLLPSVHKEAIALLSIGTFLEYFDFMLYVHMSVLLNELFFPVVATPYSIYLAPFALAANYILRPFASFIFGWLGDNIGRKAVIIITTTIMAFSCAVMAHVGTYAQIGIVASWIVTICRVLQGMASTGGIMGAAIYLTETIKPPLRYSAVAAIGVAGALGGSAALGLASLVTSYGFNWRMAFRIGTGIAIVGIVARTTLCEASDYVDAKRRVKASFQKANQDLFVLKDDAIFQDKINKKVLLSYFVMESISPLLFHINYIYCGELLKDLFAFTSEQVIHRNWILGCINFLCKVILAFSCYKIHPLKIIKYKLIVFVPFFILMPYLLNIARNAMDILAIQCIGTVLCCSAFLANPIIFMYFPIFKRFSAITITFSTAKAVMYTISSFGIPCLIRYFGNFGLFILILPLTIGYIFARSYFEQLERGKNSYH